jgi:colanic acid/amylovoran biosynthesis glycosyltransferase
MRVAFFVADFPQRSEIFVVNQVVGLLDRGHDVHIFTRRLFGEDHLHEHTRPYRLLDRTAVRFHFPGRPSWQQIGGRLLLCARNLTKYPGLVLHSLNFLRYGRSALSLRLLDQALFFLSQERFDIVHCHFGANGEEAAILRGLGVLDAPIVTTFHGYDIRDGIERGAGIFRQLLCVCDEVHSISEYNHRHLEAFGFPPEKIIFHPMGVDLRRFVERTPHIPGHSVSKRLRLLTVARLSREKGVDVALHAMAALRALRPNAHLTYRVLGEGPERYELERLRDRLGLSDCVELAGAADQDAIARELQECDLYVLPSRAESLPVAIMEAMASGCPVVATRVGGVEELVKSGNTGQLVKSEDPQGMAEAMAALLDSPADRVRFGSAGRRLVEQRHDLEVLNDKLVERYRRLGERTGPAT